MKLWAWVKNNRFFVLLGLAFATVLCIVHWHWISGLSPLTSSDWPFFYPDLMKSWAPFHGFWINYDGLGRPIVQGNFVFLFGLYGYIAHLGANFEIISRLLFFLPVLILAPVGTFLAVNRIVSNRIAALTASFIYSLNSYFIVIQGGHMHLCVTYALAPWVYYLAMKGTKLAYLGMFSIMSVIGIYDIRMALIILMFALVIAFFFNVKDRYDFISYLVTVGIGMTAFIAFNSFWMLPMYFSKVGPFATNAFHQDALNWVTDIDALTLHHPFWSTTGVSDFVFQPVSLFMMILPVLALMPLGFKKFPHKKYLIFFGVIFVIASIMLMQNNSPLHGLYTMFYEKVPLMSMFRESTKIFFVTAFCYSVLIGILIAGLLEYRKKQYHFIAKGIAVLTLVVMALTVAPYLTGHYVKAFNSEKPSADINAINDLVNPNTAEQHRTLWVSRVPKFAHIRPNKVNLDALTLSTIWGKYADQFDTLGYLKENNVVGLLDFAGVKYVVVPSDTIDLNYRHYGDHDAQYYRDIVSKWGLKKVYEKDGSTVWKNENYKPQFYFSTNTIETESISDYSGLHNSPYSTYLFKEQNLKLLKQDIPSDIVDNTELQPFSPEYLTINQGSVSSNLKPAADQVYSMFQYKTLDNSQLDNGYQQSAYKNTPLKISSTDITGLNLYRNGSFETNQDITLIDANNADRTTHEKNRIKATRVSDAKDGKYALQISARKHIADVTQEIRGFDKDAYYALSFSYKYQKGPAPLVGIYPYKTDPTKRLLPLSTAEPNKWQTYHAFIKPGDYDDGNVSIMFYVTTKKDQTFDSSVIIDDVKLQKLPSMPKEYLQTTNPEKTSIEVASTSPNMTSHEIAAKGLNEERLFVFSEAYDPNWVLTVRSPNSGATFTQPSDTHIIANGFANSWKVNPEDFPKGMKNAEGDYVLALQYKPQKWFTVGSRVTLGVALFGVALAGFLIIRKKR